MRTTTTLLFSLAVFVLQEAKALNTCLDPTSEDFVCTLGPGSRTESEVRLADCGLVNEDVDDVAACLDSLGREDITYVSLRNNLFTHLPVGLFDGLPNLEWLVLGLNDLEYLETGLLDGLPNLIRLGLRENSLTTVPPGVFAGLTSLLVLVIGNNFLTSVPPGSFDSQTNIDLLDLRGNQLSTLPEGLFANLPDTADLYVFNNPDLQCLPSSDATPLIVQDPDSASPNFEASVLEGICECPEDACTGGDVCTPGNEGYVCGDAPEPTVNACLDSSDPGYRCDASVTGRSINLNRCGLTDADTDMLRACFEDTVGPIDAIRTINLGNNDFTTLPGDVLDGMTSLSTLNIRNACDLTCIPSLDTGGSSSPAVSSSGCNADAIENTCS